MFYLNTLNCALIDTGCSATVCGKSWLQCYVDTLPENTILEECQSGKVFKFGAGKAYPSIKQVNIPVHIGEQPGYILTDVVDCEIQLLLCEHSMKKADSKLDFVNDVLSCLVNKYSFNIPPMDTIVFQSHPKRFL